MERQRNLVDGVHARRDQVKAQQYLELDVRLKEMPCVAQLFGDGLTAVIRDAPAVQVASCKHADGKRSNRTQSNAHSCYHDGSELWALQT